MSTRPRRNHDDLLLESQDALERDDLVQAEALARRALMRRPASLQARQMLATSLIEQGHYEPAVACLEQILETETENLVALADLGLCMFEMCDFDDAEAVLTRAREIDPADAQSCYWLALCLERRGQYRLAERNFRQAHESDPEAYPLPTRISRIEFEETIEEALDDLPEEIRAQLDELTIVAADLPSTDDLRRLGPLRDPCIFGMYSGVPLPERSTTDIAREPDMVFVYQRNLERMCRDRGSLVDEIRITLLHEIGHYLGYDEQELAERGLA